MALLRPAHWAKNLVVLAPLAFAGRLTDPPALRLAALTAAAFCLLASGGYALNDLVDAASDRLHPGKAGRPLSSGRLPRPAAAALGLACLGAGLWLGAAAAREAPPLSTAGLAALDPLDWCLAYLGLTASYTLLLRRVPVLDVLALAAGFVLRAWAGSAALQLVPSRWLLACSFCLALFLAVAKRRLEASQLGPATRGTRPALAALPLAALDRALDVSAALAALAYVAYTVAPDTRAKVGGAWLALSLPPALGLLARARARVRRDAASDPVELLLRDPPTLAGFAAWLALVLAVVYRSPW